MPFKQNLDRILDYFLPTMLALLIHVVRVINHAELAQNILFFFLSGTYAREAFGSSEPSKEVQVRQF